MLQSYTAEPILVSTLKQLMGLGFLNDFYLVGGTALALQLGHRNSVDIDLFTHNDFDVDRLSNDLATHFGDAFQQTGSNKIMLFCFINNVKVDFVNNRTQLQFPLQHIEDIILADVKDIAPLKMKAIFGRGSKKDFIDLYVLLQEFEVEELLNLFKTKFPFIDIGQLLISMHYFGDAENDVLPKLYIDASWQEMKSFISKKIIAYLKN